MHRFLQSRFVVALVVFGTCVMLMNVLWFSKTTPYGRSPHIPEHRTSPEKILQMVTPLARRSQQTYNATASRTLVRGIVDHAFANRLNGTRHQEALEIRRALEAYPLLPCRLDKPLLNSTVSRNASLFFASAVRDVEDVMPNLIVQLCRLALLLPKGKLYVSIYESASEDATPQWLLILKELLDLLRCPNRIVLYGAVRQGEEESLMQFHARLRNVAVRPLLDSKLGVFHKVVMVDDVFFCAQHVLRLYAWDMDVVCGMDFVEAPPKRRWIERGRREAPLLTFRDVWSSIDVTGRHFKALPPFVLDAYGRGLLYRGHPFPVHSCANGIMAVRPGPFFQHTFFRGRPSGSCPASENVLLCQDFIRAGLGKIAVDPGVKVGHVFRDAMYVHRHDSNGDVPFVPFDSVPSPIGFPHQPSEVECCERLQTESHQLKFKFCQKEKIHRVGQAL